MDLVLNKLKKTGSNIEFLLSMGAAKYVQLITGMPISDPTGGYKCFRRGALLSIDLASK